MYIDENSVKDGEHLLDLVKAAAKGDDVAASEGLGIKMARLEMIMNHCETIKLMADKEFDLWKNTSIGPLPDYPR